jgi:diphthine-ammonia ligase
MGFEAYKNGAEGRKFVCSWSGGKDSCLALYRMVRKGTPVRLFTMLDETGERSRSHALPPAFLMRQAEALGLPHECRSAAWGEYEPKFIAALRQFRAQGVEAAVFGDIDLEDHGKWEEMVCREAGLQLCLPLWQEDRRALAEEFIAAGFRAVIVTVNTRKNMDMRFLGREYARELLPELADAGVDLCGENGEFHTAVFDGPIFKNPVDFHLGECVRHEEYGFIRLN